MDRDPKNLQALRAPLIRWSETPWVLEVMTLIFSISGAVMILPLISEMSKLMGRWGLSESAQAGDSSLLRFWIIAASTNVLLAAAFFLRHRRAVIVSQASPFSKETGFSSREVLLRFCYEALAAASLVIGVMMALGTAALLFGLVTEFRQSSADAIRDWVICIAIFGMLTILLAFGAARFNQNAGRRREGIKD